MILIHLDLLLPTGVGHVVQINELPKTRRKYIVEKLIVTANRGFISADKWEIIIVEHLLPGTEIWTD